jgi:hypothetical protein
VVRAAGGFDLQREPWRRILIILGIIVLSSMLGYYEVKGSGVDGKIIRYLSGVKPIKSIGPIGAHVWG